MIIDKIVEQTILKKNPCIVGLDPEWDRIPDCYKIRATQENRAEVIYKWACDIIDSVADIVVAVKPQMAFYEMYGAQGFEVFQKIVEYAHNMNLVVIDDSKRNDIGNTAKAYAFAHLSENGPIKADYLTVSPFLGTDSLEPFMDIALKEKKGLIILVQTTNPSSVEISESRNQNEEMIRDWLADYIYTKGENCVGKFGYSSIGAVVGATFPEQAKKLRKIMKNNYFLVPGFGAQGGKASDIVNCFNEDGLGALISSSRGITYQHLCEEQFDGTREMYLKIVRRKTIEMQQQVYFELRKNLPKMCY